MDVESCRAIVESVDPNAKKPKRSSDWLDLALDLHTFRALMRTLAGLAGTPVDLFIAELLFVRKGRFECSEFHLDQLFAVMQRKRYDETGKLLEEPLTWSDF